MSFKEYSEIDQIEVTNFGYVHVRQANYIEKDGNVISKTYKRWTLTPDSDITNQEQKVQDICNATWTSEAKIKYEQFKEEQKKLIENQIAGLKGVA